MSTPEQDVKTNAALRKSAESNLPRTRAARPDPAGAKFSRIVHAYRREPHVIGEKEQHVEVEFGGEKAKFFSNEAGHVIATVTSQALFDRLTKGIPEAYIEYSDGENVPERIKPGFEEPEVAKFVLVNGDNKLRLDDLNDDELKEFAKTNGVVVHESLAGDDLRQAIFNVFQG